MEKLILLLGAPNDSNGKLSNIALDRLECALPVYRNNKDVKFLCTGGFGEQFNTTGQPHAYYSREWLISHGAEEKDFLPFVLSSNTYEDFKLASRVIHALAPALVIVITSDFHCKRAQMLCNELVGYENVLFIPARSHLPEEQLIALVGHEKKAIKCLYEKGIL